MASATVLSVLCGVDIGSVPGVGFLSGGWQPFLCLPVAAGDGPHRGNQRTGEQQQKNQSWRQCEPPHAVVNTDTDEKANKQGGEQTYEKCRNLPACDPGRPGRGVGATCFQTGEDQGAEVKDQHDCGEDIGRCRKRVGILKKTKEKNANQEKRRQEYLLSGGELAGMPQVAAFQNFIIGLFPLYNGKPQQKTKHAKKEQNNGGDQKIILPQLIVESDNHKYHGTQHKNIPGAFLTVTVHCVYLPIFLRMFPEQVYTN